MKYQSKNNGMLEQLLQLTSLTWDGDLISKAHAHELWQKGLVDKVNGFYFITKEGIEILDKLKIINC